MKRLSAILGALAIVAVSSIACSSVQTAPGDAIKLQQGWQISREGDAKTYPATVPSTVAGTLYNCGEIPADIFVGENYFSFDKSIFDSPWTYKTSFKLGPKKGEHIFLRFDGIDFRADITLNGTKLASADETFGVFNVFEYDITSVAKANNTLEVTLQRARPGDLNIGFVDWNPRPLDESMGIWRDVTVNVTGPVKMDDVFVKPLVDPANLAEADIEVRATLSNLTDKDVAGVLKGTFDGKAFEVPAALAAGQVKEVVLTKEQVAAFHVTNPKLWWCQPLGDPNLYNIDLAYYADGALSDSESTTFGIRSITSEIDAEGHLQFVLNGTPVLIKGAGWTDDIFLRDTHESIDRQVRYAADMNMNCLRFENIWGKDATVYDCCDKYGLLAYTGWSCQWEWEPYCGLPESESGLYGCIITPETIEIAKGYFRHQVKWMRNHPSVISWMVGSDCLPHPDLEKAYLEMMAELDYRPYIGSAKAQVSTITGPTGTKMAGPYDYVAPEYWYIDKHLGGAFGFNTETGIGPNMPVIESVRKMIPEDQLWPVGRAWDKHCTASSSCMNTAKLLKEVVAGYYGEPTNVEDFVSRACAIDYNGTRAMFEAFRANLPHTTGVVQWMFNSAWPSIYWQQFDWYGVPTGGYYGTKKACEPVQLIYNYADKCVYAVNETAAAVSSKASMKVYNASSKLIAEASKDVTVAPRVPVKVFDLKMFRGTDHFLALELDNPAADNFYCIAANDNVHDFKNSEWYVTYITKYSDFSFVSNLPKAKIKCDVAAEVKDGKTILTVKLTNEQDAIAYQNVLKLKDAEGEIVVPSFWSDNFVTLLPGQTKTLTCTAEKVFEEGKFSVEIVSGLTK